MSPRIYYLPPTEGGTQVDRFCDNYIQADEACEGYIWLYGEKRPWIDWKGGVDKPWRRAPTWDDAMPGLYDIFAARRDVVSFGARKCAQLDASGVATNLVANGDCALNADCSGFKTNKFAKGFNSWRNKKEEGSFGTDADVGRGDSFSVRLDNMVRGCVIAYADVFAPGKTILVRLHAKGDNPHATVYYTKDRKWRFSLGNARVKFDEPSADGWRAGYAVVSIPHGADGFGVQMCGSAKGKVWYDDIGAYLIR